jgi:hypothetical protein
MELDRLLPRQLPKTMREAAQELGVSPSYAYRVQRLVGRSSLRLLKHKIPVVVLVLYLARSDSLTISSAIEMLESKPTEVIKFVAVWNRQIKS